MPRYTFVDPTTKKEYDVTMSFDDLEKFKKHFPDHEQVFKMNVVDPIRIGVTKPPADFQKYVLERVKQSPGADKVNMNKRWTAPKEI